MLGVCSRQGLDYKSRKRPRPRGDWVYAHVTNILKGGSRPPASGETRVDCHDDLASRDPTCIPVFIMQCGVLALP